MFCNLGVLFCLRVCCPLLVCSYVGAVQKITDISNILVLSSSEANITRILLITLHFFVCWTLKMKARRSVETLVT
jgi:hypothetical protein